MARSFSVVPIHLDDPDVLRQFLERLVERVDAGLADRGIVETTVDASTLQNKQTQSQVIEQQYESMLARIVELESKVKSLG